MLIPTWFSPSVLQAVRQLTDGVDGVVRSGLVVIRDRDPTWSGAVVSFLEGDGVRVIRTPARAPNCNVYAGAVRAVHQKGSVWTVCWCWASGTYVVPSGVRQALPRRSEPPRSHERAA